MSRKKLAVLISGRGSNMEAILEASRDSSFPAEIVVVLSDKPDTAGLQTARENNIPAIGIAHDDFQSRSDHETAITKAITDHNPDFICLAGYMRILSSGFVQQFEGRLINIHPSLLPSFKGLETHQRAIDAGVKLHGCTVHFVNAEMDGGAVIAQAVVPVLPDDDEKKLAARVLAAEHKLYPHAIRMLAENKVRLENGCAVTEPLATNSSETSVLFSPDIE